LRAKFKQNPDYWFNKANDGENNRVRLAIVFDKLIINAPTLRGPITGGAAVISGGGTGFTRDEAVRLLRSLQSGLNIPATEPAAAP